MTAVGIATVSEDLEGRWPQRDVASLLGNSPDLPAEAERSSLHSLLLLPSMVADEIRVCPSNMINRLMRCWPESEDTISTASQALVCLVGARVVSTPACGGIYSFPAAMEYLYVRRPLSSPSCPTGSVLMAGGASVRVMSPALRVGSDQLAACLPVSVLQVVLHDRQGLRLGVFTSSHLLPCSDYPMLTGRLTADVAISNVVDS